MKNLYQLKNNFSFKMALFAVLLMFSSNQLFADGSLDLYPANATGYRAYLRSSTTAQTERWPYPTVGTHYVYATIGETITMASSAQNGGSAVIRLFNPSNNPVTLTNPTTAGQIANRTQELAGPQLLNQTGGNRYTPIYHTVTVTGIYRIELVARGTSDPGVTFFANSNWTQDSTAGIFAWDISVIKNDTNTFIKGRVYTNLLNLSNGINNPGSDTNALPENNGFRGIVYGLTNDGFTYRVNNNGNNGLWFSFFINNNGFTDANGVSIYKSLNKTNLTASEAHNPLSADINTPTNQQVTHKIFYTLPAADLPVTTPSSLITGAVPGGSTWLRVVPVVPVVSNLSTTGVEGTNGQISSKGGYIKFTSNRPAKYSIIIKSTATPAAFSQRVLLGFAAEGPNSILWDGKGGNGAALPPGTYPAEISVQLQGAEVHFPYIDMEYNKEGTIIQLLDKDNLSQVASSLVYWNDEDIPNATAANSGNNAPFGRYSDPKNNTHLPPTPPATTPLPSNGIDSRINGHIWGQGATGNAGQFGDLKAMDTWAFVKGPVETATLNFQAKVADLKISQLTADKTKIVPGDILTVYVKAKNDGPSNITGSKFTFTLPVGFTPNSAIFGPSACGSQATAISYDPGTRTYTSSLDLINGCEIGYTFTMTVTNTVAAGNQNFRATILRPNDVTDPDATNPNPQVPPTDATAECANNGLGGACNNIKSINLTYSTTAVCTEQVLGQDFDVTTPTPNPNTASDINNNVITFSQPATNNGFVFDIYFLDNSFNMNINGTALATSEIEFQADTYTPNGINVRFADGTLYGPSLQIYNLEGSSAAPVLRVVISNTGAISMFGSKTSGGPLFPLELFNGNTFNTIPWNSAGSNTVRITQSIYGATRIAGRGYGQNIVNCACYDLPNTSGAGVATPHGITLLNRAGANNGNWPMNRTSALTVLESNTKGFVISRASTVQINSITTPIDGMMVYDNDAKCLKIYTVDTAVPANTGWKCFSTPACP